MSMTHQPDNFPDFMSTLGTDKSQRHSLPADTHKKISKLQKTIEDDSLIHSEDDDLPSVTQLGRTLTQWTYRIKSKIASYQRKNNQKTIFNNYEEGEKHLELNSLTKRQLCSLLHNFYDPSHTLIPQIMLFSRYTWRQLHDLKIWNGMLEYHLPHKN